VTDQQDVFCNQDRGRFCMGRLWKTACSEAKCSRLQGLPHEATARGIEDAVFHRLYRGVENPCLDSKDPRSQRAWADKRPADWSRVSHTPLLSTEVHCDGYGDVPSSTDKSNSRKVGTFSINKWVLFRLSRFRRNGQSGYFFDQQVGTFSIDKNNQPRCKLERASLSRRPRSL
jgi:hypothetical protein